MTDWTAEQMRERRYRVTCADGLTLRRSFDDLEEAGQLLLENPGAVDVYDNHERVFIEPFDIPRVRDTLRKR